MVPTIHHGEAAPGPDPEANLERIRGWAESATLTGASLLLTPELFVTAEATTRGAALRERLRGIAISTGVQLIASTPEATGDSVFIGAHWFDASGALVAHTRKQHLAPWQRARGFSAWYGPPPFIPESVYSLAGLHGPVAMVFAADAQDPSISYYLRDHGVQSVLALDDAGTHQKACVAAGAWAPKNTGEPFPQAGRLPEPLLRPLPRIADSWWSGPGRQHRADFGS